jgi:hypothetical protein
MATSINDAVRPMVPKLAQAGAPHTGAHDGDFVRATQSLWWRCSATRRTWGWADPDTAPFISTATLGTYTDISIGSSGVNATLMLPWYYQKGVDGLQLSVLVCLMGVTERASLQATLTGLDAAITADKDCPAAIINPTGAPPPGLWSRLTNSWRMGVVGLRFTGITTDNMTADRRGSIKLSISFDPVTTPDNLSITHEAKIYAVHARDIFTTPDPEDEA